MVTKYTPPCCLGNYVRYVGCRKSRTVDLLINGSDYNALEHKRCCPILNTNVCRTRLLFCVYLFWGVVDLMALSDIHYSYLTVWHFWLAPSWVTFCVCHMHFWILMLMSLYKFVAKIISEIRQCSASGANPPAALPLDPDTPTNNFWIRHC